ncbi:unnamed protein product [Agarophyton chilense]|eukprot:gb/GEZJ01005364.1/.p1 GENE.gb/GEZJ01005364.1/~~gb/GEZJ01005364.1/.p1  ORF type:complete len:437 (-),score=49.77 gb/GEZJ01005364.1/:1230-2540(-)
MEFRFSGRNQGLSFILETPPPSGGLKLITPHADSICSLLHNRIRSPIPPKHLDPYTIKFLEELPYSTLNQIEVKGASEVLFDEDMPPFLRKLTNLATELSHYFPYMEQKHPLQKLQKKSISTAQDTRKRIKLAKLHQIGAVTSCARHIASQVSSRSIRRIVDMGAGHAHLAASLRTMLDLPTVAIDCDPALIQTAKTLYGTIPNLTIHKHLVQSLRSSTMEIMPNDMLFGLHSCGSLGETVVKMAAAKQVAAVFLVSCCLQKLESSASFRQPLSDVVLQDPKLRKLLTVERKFLGATNRSRNAPCKSNKARVTRYALRKLLADRGLSYRHGNEVEGLSRHIFKYGLLHVSQKFAKIHNIDLRLGENEAIERAKNAAVDYSRMQALGIPRAIAGEVLEKAIILDRASMLEKTFPVVRTMQVWPESISVKNLAIAAWK